jgi:hypothetical protein
MNTTTAPNAFAGRRLVVGSAIYDLSMTTVFATPWTATTMLWMLKTLHLGIGLGGAPLPSFSPSHLFFVGLLGCVVTTWSVVRLLWPSPELGSADGVTRLAFSGWMVWALTQGASHLLVGLLVVESSFGVAQLVAFRRVWRRSRR